MTFKAVSAGWPGRILVLSSAVFIVAACSPREQTRGKRWKAQVDAYLKKEKAPVEGDWKMKVSEEEEEVVEQKPLTFPEVLESLPNPQSWPQLQSGMVLRFLAAQGKGDWRTEVQNRLLHLFFIYVNDSDRYSTKRWDKAVTRLNVRLDAIEARLPENSQDRRMLEQVRSQVELSDLEVKKRFEKGDGLGEVQAFEMELQKFKTLDKGEVAGRVGGEAELDKMIKTADEIRSTMNNLMGRHPAAGGKSKMEAWSLEWMAVLKRDAAWRKEYAKAMQDPLVARYFKEHFEEVHGGETLVVPDLVTIVGESKAEELLKQTLALPVRLEVPIGDGTRALAMKTALQNIDQLKLPQWGLTHSLQGVALFEALQKRFPVKEGAGRDDFQRENAEVYYLFGLIAQNRSDDALAWAGTLGKTQTDDNQLRMPYELLDQMVAAGYGEQVWSFLTKLLDRYPEIPFWANYIELSSRLDKNTGMLQLVEKAAKRTDLKVATRWNLQRSLASAYLAADRVEEGVAVLRTALAQPAADSDSQAERNEAALQLVQLGQLLQRSDWIEEGLAISEAYVAGLPADSVTYDKLEGLPKIYEKLGRSEDAERVLRAGLQKLREARLAQEAQKLEPNDSSYRVRQSYWRGGEKDFLEALLALSVNQNKDKEALKLLTESPDWDKSDLADLLKDQTGYPSYPVGYWSSWALARLGKNDEALAVAKGQIRVMPGSDGAYAILTQLNGLKALPFLDKIYRMDQFQERPLIWKARVLSEAGELDEAEKAAKAAIAIDPSDGEEGKGDRMRVYAVMAEIEKKKGDVEKAKFFENVVRAIRLSEDADDFFRAGLNTQAIAMYKEALTFFSDAYCIQSRLALRLAKENKEEEALLHYQKAYELMPDSFGRVESHCFGCERAFKGEKAQGLAEKVFMGMLKTHPGKPQVYYLLGYLREEQQRYAEALEYYRQAVALDPLYLNAWKRMAGMKGRIHIDPRVLDKVQLRLLSLDPTGQHSHPDLQSINDLPKLWGHLALADDIINTVPVPEAVFELTASSEVLRAKNQNLISSSSFGEGKSFGQILLEHPAVRSLKEALDLTRSPGSSSMQFESEMLEY